MPGKPAFAAPDLPRVAALLQRFNVDCILVGGMSARLYGSTLMTSDSDIVTDWSRANLDALVEAFETERSELRVGIDDEGQDIFRRLPGGIDVEDVRHLSSFRVRTRHGDLIDVLRTIPIEPGDGGGASASATCSPGQQSSRWRTTSGSASSVGRN